jgi:NADPH-dependent F420 reductase
MGRGFAQALGATHDVVMGSRDPAKAAAKAGVSQVTTYAEAVADAELVILTVPWQAMDETLGRITDALRPGTVVVDVSFPYTKAEREELHRKRSSTAEAIQQRLPGMRVLKAFNHVHARHLTEPEVDGIAASVLMAGDDQAAKEVVAGIARDMGFHPVDAGPLRATRDLEVLVATTLFVRLGPIRVLAQP